jgi:hypothetical protein
MDVDTNNINIFVTMVLFRVGVRQFAIAKEHIMICHRREFHLVTTLVIVHRDIMRASIAELPPMTAEDLSETARTSHGKT